MARSPGSYFVERARDLILAPKYFNHRLPDNAYGGTATDHLNRLCETTYASILSAFELTWKTMFGLIVDSATMYDGRLLSQKATKDSVKLESLLAHRGEGSIGQVLAASLGGGVWQQPRLVNERFLALMEVEPLGSTHTPRLAELWQIRHVIVHNTGVVTPLDAHRLNDATLAGKALRIDLDFLDDVEDELVQILKEGCGRIGDRIVCDSKSQTAAGGNY